MILAASFRPVLLAWFAAAGLAVGSFLNVVIYRVPLGFFVSLPSRSACRKCKRRLAWYENIPVFSYLALRARCRTCASPISARYPLVEIMTSALFVAVFGYYGATFATLYYSAFCAALVAITFIDLDHRIIPDVISFPFIAIGLLGSLAVPGLGIANSAMGAAAGGFGFWFMAWGYQKISGREGLGFGDVKLLAMIGAFLGPRGALGTVLLSSIVGSVVGIVIMIVQKKNLKLALPFGPFLALGAFVYLFWGDYLALRIYPQFYE